MNADYLPGNPIPVPTQMHLIPSMFLVYFPTQGFVLNYAMQSSLYSLGLLLDELDSVGKEDNLLLLSVRQVIVHRYYCDSGLAQSCRQVYDRVPVLALLEQSLLVISQAHSNLGPLDVFQNI